MINNYKNGDDNSHSLQIIGFLVTVVLLMLYLTIGMYMESKHFRFGHETGVIIIIGIIISILTVIFHNKDVSFLEWNNNLFVACLSGLHVDRIIIKNNKVVGEERLLTDKNDRFRDITYLNGMLYTITDGGDVYRISKK